MEYRGINLADSVRLYNKDNRCGLYNMKVKQLIDNFIEVLSKNGHYLKGVYAGNKGKVTIQYQCKHEFTWSRLQVYMKSDGTCPVCPRKRSIEAKEHFMGLLDGINFRLKGNYVNTTTMVEVVCNNGHLIKATPEEFSSGRRCGKCINKITSKEDGRENFYNALELVNYTALGEYKKATLKVEIKCDKGHTFSITPNAIVSAKQGCPHCSESKGEKRIRKFLEENKVKFKAQHKYKGLVGVGKGLLSYDFYLPKQNILIEYQGQYHDGTAGNQTEEEYEKQLEHDKRKKEYALVNNINLLEIWYWDFDNVEEILQREII